MRVSRSLPKILYVISDGVFDEEFRIKQLRLHGFDVDVIDRSDIPSRDSPYIVVMGMNESRECIKSTSELLKAPCMVISKDKGIDDNGNAINHEKVSSHFLFNKPVMTVFVDGDDVKFSTTNFSTVLKVLGFEEKV